MAAAKALCGILAVCFIAGIARAQSQPDQEAFVQSLTLRPERFITDSSHTAIVWLSQTSPVASASTLPLKLTLSLTSDIADAKTIKELGSFDIYRRNLADNPFAVSFDLSGIADDNYRIIADLSEGDTSLCKLSKPLVLVAGIDSKQSEIEQRLKKIPGHESTKATIEYPFDFARVINIGKRNWTAADLGIDQQGHPNYYDFTEGIKQSEQLLTALEAGTDPLWQATGEHERHYLLTESAEIMPYRVYVPPTWDGKTPLPMVFILHGDTRNQDFYFQRDDKIIPKTAAKHGFMLVGVFGYYPNGGYNSNTMNRASARPPAVARAGNNNPPSMNGMPLPRIWELSEIDAMHVFDLVKQEYPIDAKRTFLFGYSHGGSGAYYIGTKYAENWAAIALGGAGNAPYDAFPYDRLKSFNIPLFIFHGGKDSAAVQNNSPAFVKALNDHGVSAQLKVYPGIDHDGGPSAAVADAFDFFAANPRK